MARYEADGLEGRIDRRLEQVSHRTAPVDEVLVLSERYRAQHTGWNVKHFHGWYRRTGGTRSYTWVKKRLYEAGLVEKGRLRGAHRKRRERSALPGRMVHQDAGGWRRFRPRRGTCHMTYRVVQRSMFGAPE